VKKITVLSVVLLLVCGAFLAAQETGSSDSTQLRFDEIRNAFPIKFEAYGKAVWAPFVYRGQGNVTDILNETQGNGPAFGSGSGPGWDNISAAVGLRIFGSDREQNYGFDLRLRAVPVDSGADAGSINIRGYDNTAYLWARPLENDILKVQLGLYQWDDLRGTIGGVGDDGAVGGYGGNEDDIFQRVESDTFGALLVLRPPAGVPDALKGLTLFSSFGVSGGINAGSDSFAAKTEKALQYIFSTPHAGIAYQHEAFGVARAQFIGSNYLWGNGEDWNTRTVSYPWYGTTTNTHYWLPKAVRDASRIEVAVNVTRIPGVNLDIGFGYPLQVTVVSRDESTVAVPVGPLWQDLGYRPRATWTSSNNRIADSVGDVWQPPIHVAAAVEFKPKDLNFGFRFRVMAEFGEQVAFMDGSDNFKGGFLFEAGLQPEYTIERLGVVSLVTAIRVKQNDSYNGKKSATDNELAITSLNHNGYIDLGLGAFFTKPFSGNSYIKTGVSATIPIGGDRYLWSSDRITGPSGVYFQREPTETFKKGNLVITVPIILEINL